MPESQLVHVTETPDVFETVFEQEQKTSTELISAENMYCIKIKLILSQDHFIKLNSM